MSQLGSAPPTPVSLSSALPSGDGALLRELIWLSAPILAENVLHMLVGLNDVYLASHLPRLAPAATAAVGAITYVLWLIGLIAGAIGAGSTAIIARAVGAGHRSLANSVCGQTMTAALLTGLGMTLLTLLAAGPMAEMTGLSGDARSFALFYLKVLSLSLPFSIVMFAANACLRGAGDSLTPAIAMIVVDVVNMVVSFALTRGWWGLPVMGFGGIAIGTVTAYVAGGLIQAIVLLSGRGKLRLFLHRLRPHWLTLKRVMRIGIPSGAEGLFTWLAQFAILAIINQIDATNIQPAAHIITVRLESLSFMGGLAVATAAATMVGQSLGMKNPARAERSAWLAFLVGAVFMGAWALIFIAFGRQLAGVLSDDQRIVSLSARCLFVAALSQTGFAASMIFGGALRGAGDTFVVMVINLASIIGLRLTGVLIVTRWLGMGLVAVWVILACELTLRGGLIYARFRQGGWRHVRV